MWSADQTTRAATMEDSVIMMIAGQWMVEAVALPLVAADFLIKFTTEVIVVEEIKINKIAKLS